MEMVKLVLVGLAILSTAQAADFSITIGSPVALGAVSKVKASVLAVRLDHCSTQAELTGTAEGLVNGDRQSIPLNLAAAPGQKSSFFVTQNWPAEGVWVVRLSAVCKNAKAGAIVPFDHAIFVREAAKFYPRFATAAEVEAALSR